VSTVPEGIMKNALLVASLAGLVATPALARQPVLLVDYPNQPITTASGKVPAPEKVREAIVLAASSKGWTTQDAGPGKLVATLLIRKHTAVVNVTYSPQSFGIAYESSANLEFEDRGFQRLVHPNYNKWVHNLLEAIQAEVVKL
jgi:hypothetical protein